MSSIDNGRSCRGGCKVRAEGEEGSEADDKRLNSALLQYLVYRRPIGAFYMMALCPGLLTSLRAIIRSA
jgi:hypothetical protein